MEISQHIEEPYEIDCVLDIQVTVQRKLGQQSNWRRIMDIVRKQAPTAFFREKQRKLVNGMRCNVHTVFTRAEMSSLTRQDGSMWWDMEAPCKRGDLERLYRGIEHTSAKVKSVEHSLSDLTRKTDSIIDALVHMGAHVKAPSTPASLLSPAAHRGALPRQPWQDHVPHASSMTEPPAEIPKAEAGVGEEAAAAMFGESPPLWMRSEEEWKRNEADGESLRAKRYDMNAALSLHRRGAELPRGALWWCV